MNKVEYYFVALLQFFLSSDVFFAVEKSSLKCLAGPCPHFLPPYACCLSHAARLLLIRPAFVWQTPPVKPLIISRKIWHGNLWHVVAFVSSPNACSVRCCERMSREPEQATGDWRQASHGGTGLCARAYMLLWAFTELTEDTAPVPTASV